MQKIRGISPSIKIIGVGSTLTLDEVEKHDVSFDAKILSVNLTTLQEKLAAQDIVVEPSHKEK